MRVLPVVTAACLWSASALADCGQEAHTVRDRVSSSGPFHFEATWRTPHWGRRYSGRIDPDKAQHEQRCDLDGTGCEGAIWIGERAWRNDGLGWEGPEGSPQSHEWRMPAVRPRFGVLQKHLLPFEFLKVTCHGRVEIDGRPLNKYEFEIRQNVHRFTETVYADVDTSVPVRFEQGTDHPGRARSVTTYRFDPTIRIEPPTVDPQQRWGTSVDRFAEAVRRADAACRTELLAVLSRGAVASFHFERAGVPHMMTGVRGTFVPPRSIHYTILGPPNHGGGAEVISIGPRSWAKDPATTTWTDTRHAGESDFIRDLLRAPDHIGYVNCVGAVRLDDAEYQAFDFEPYVDTSSARKPAGMRRVLVDRGSGFPVRMQVRWRDGSMATFEQRRYDPGITIVAPESP